MNNNFKLLDQYFEKGESTRISWKISYKKEEV